MSFLASLDQSTTSTKFTIFTENGTCLVKTIIQHSQICPAEGLLEHDPMEIIQNVQRCIEETFIKKQSEDFKGKILGLGITNQRQTIVCWDKNGKPYYNAIVWCDTRAKQICKQFEQKYGSFKTKTGLPILWLIDNVAEIKQGIKDENIRFGTIDTWVIYNLTGEYVTDASNASRTYLCNLQGEWDEELLKIAGLKRQFLPTIVDSFGKVGKIKAGSLKGLQICSILGDQQSSAYAHQLKTQEMKISYGTGCFLLTNIGKTPIIHESFLTTILYKHKQHIQYAFQCSLECGAGTLNWAKRTGFFQNYQELNELQETHQQDLYFFPSFGEIYAPFWKTDVRGGIVGLSLTTTFPHILYALLESIVFRLRDNLKDPFFDEVQNVYADGGMTVNHQFMQLQANLFRKNVIVRDRDTCWGVAKGVLTCFGKDHPSFQNQHTKKYTCSSPHENKRLVEKYNHWNIQRNKFYQWS